MIKTNKAGGVFMIVNVNFRNPFFSENGIFQGWGTSLCWWANRVGYSPVLTKKCAELFFSPDGLNLNIMRYNIGGGDDPDHNHIKRTDSIVPGWAVFDKKTNSFTYDYTADKNQLNVLSACYNSAKNPLVEVFSNSPPYFMTKTGCTSGAKDPNENNLKEECYEDFARYLAHVTEYINNKLNIKVTSLSPMNEPNTDYWHYLSEKQEGCHFDKGESQNKILQLTHKEAQKLGLTDVITVGSDETATDKAITSLLAYSPEVRSFLTRINAHTYCSKKAKKLGEICKNEGLNLWMSETDWGDVAGTNAGQMGAGLWLSKKITEDINKLSPSAWVLWQVIDSHKSKDGYCGNKDSGIPDKSKGFWGLAFADHDTQDIILTQKYYCMAQYSKFINYGDTIYHVNDKIICAYNGSELKIVAFNTSSRHKSCTFDFKETNVVFSSVQPIRTSGTLEDGESCAYLQKETFKNNIYKAKLKPNSVTTFIFR